MGEPQLVTARPGRSARDLGLPPLSGFRPDVQALRGLAVLLVVLYHARVVAPGGFVGVDVFFVISGYVIGRRLVARLAGRTGGVMTEFYVHRARRILPPLAVMLAVVILAAPLLAPIGGVSATSPTGVAAALFSANAYLYRSSGVGYFAPAAALNPLLHTWSLSVEEQFYFVIPALLFVAWRFGRKRFEPVTMVRALVGLLALGSFVLCVWLTEGHGSALHVDGTRFAFFSPFTRAWEFAAGLALVLLPKRWLAGPRVRPVLAVVGLLMICVAARRYSDATLFPGYAALLPVVGAAIVVYAGTRADADATPRTPVLLRPWTWMGDLSYSWYLWHWPLIVFVGGFWVGSGSLPLVVAAAFSLLPAWLSYRWLERPLRATPKTRARPTAMLAVVCILAPIAAAVVAVPIRTLVNRHAASSFLAVDQGTGDQPGDSKACDNATPIGQRPAGTCTWGGAAGAPSVVLVGDSNAAQFSNAFIGAGDATGARLRIADLSACPFADIEYELLGSGHLEVAPGDCRRFVMDTVADLEAHPPKVVALALATDQWVFVNPDPMRDPATGELTTDRAAKARILEDGLVRVVNRLEAAGSTVVLLDVVPKPYSFDTRSCSNLAIIADPARCLPPPFAVGAHAAMTDANQLQARVAQRTGSTTWDFSDEVCPGGRCTAVQDGRLVWRDPVHISASTSTRLTPAMTSLLRNELHGAATP